ncbi:MAG: Fe-S cluster assembly ATPase SufC [Deltaproteobacteria bacterium]|nr:Fe-S cluster assembly ATPase SufC [Deltaproteobacteria bacterium]
MLTIENLHVEVDGKAILKGLSLTVPAGEVHAIMGPNGSGKSTLSYVLAGKEGYVVTAGSIRIGDFDLLEMSVDERAQAGVFLAFQYPVEVPGVNNKVFLRHALNAKRKAAGQPELDAVSFIKLLNEKLALVGMSKELAGRELNSGYSGGEKKKNEILQMAMLDPKLAILDEIDSGLDIDALKAVAAGVNALRSPQRSMLLITHYQRLLDAIAPDHVHVLLDGRIVHAGGPELALELEERGYDWLRAA